MSASHDNHSAKKSGGKSMDFGILSMLGGAFGGVSCANAIETLKEGGSSGGGHDHH